MTGAMPVDHLLLAVPDLSRGVAAFAARTGVAPAAGGTHPGFGTRNALVSLGPGIYFELIAPDPAQGPPDSGISSRFSALIGRTDSLATFAVRVADLATFARAAAAAGAAVGAALRMGRTRPDGARLEWTLMFADHPDFGTLLPFAIDWRDSPHPSASAPSGCTLRALVARHPEPDRLAALYAALGVAVGVERGPPGLVAYLDTPLGALVV